MWCWHSQHSQDSSVTERKPSRHRHADDGRILRRVSYHQSRSWRVSWSLAAYVTPRSAATRRSLQLHNTTTILLGKTHDTGWSSRLIMSGKALGNDNLVRVITSSQAVPVPRKSWRDGWQEQIQAYECSAYQHTARASSCQVLLSRE